MQIHPYLFYNGRCDEAIAFYRAAVGAEVTMLMRYRDSPEPNPHGPPDKVMYASLRIGDATVLVSDGRCEGAPEFQGFAVADGGRRCPGGTVIRGPERGRPSANAAGEDLLFPEVRHARRPLRRDVDGLRRGVRIAVLAAAGRSQGMAGSFGGAGQRGCHPERSAGSRTCGEAT